MAEVLFDPPLPEEEPLNEVLQVMMWIGFQGAQAERVAIQIGGKLQDFAKFSHSDVKMLTESLRGLPANVRIHVTLAQAKHIKATIDWVKDQDRIDKTPSIVGLDEETFLKAIQESAKRDVIREAAKENAETLAKAASPGKLTGEKVWDTWKAGLENQLSMLYGVNGVPLVYVIRKDERPEEGKTYDNFTQESIEKCKLSGQEFVEDAKYVHNIIQALIVGEDAEQWVKDHKRAKNGRTDFLTLVAHFTGEGNNTRRVGDAERLEKTLHYKDERAMGFQTFLAKTKHMFNIFEEVGEPKTESAKIRFLLDGVRSTELQPIVQAIRAGMTLEANAYTFTTAANMIASQVTPKETHRSVSGLERESGDKIKTEFLSGSKWRALSPDQQAAIRAAREKDPTIKKKSQKQKSVSNRKDRKIKNLQKKISALKRKAGDDNASDDDDADASAGASAGNAFGGREEKKQAKKKTKN
jgi:3-methyladenine DNA glycosylase/8-oxoguanine DNA glycosylase